MPVPPSSRATDPSLPLAYDTLRELAQRVLRRWTARARIGRTSLVHETFLRLAGRVRGGGAGEPQLDEQHWLAIAARAMRFVLVDDARRAAAGKRAGGEAPLSLDDVTAPVPPERLVALGDALDELATIDLRRARIVELRAFGGLTVDEVAATLGVSASTVFREWPLAKAWLYRRLRADAS